MEQIDRTEIAELSDRVAELTKKSEEQAVIALSWARKMQTEQMTEGEYRHATMEMNKHFRLADRLLNRAEELLG